VIKKLGKTILLTTHYLHEAEELCDRIAIIDQGKIVALDTTQNLKKIVHSDVNIVIDIKNGREKAIKKIKTLKFVKKLVHIWIDKAQIPIFTEIFRELKAENFSLSHKNVEIHGFTPDEVNDFFKNL